MISDPASCSAFILFGNLNRLSFPAPLAHGKHRAFAPANYVASNENNSRQDDDSQNGRDQYVVILHRSVLVISRKQTLLVWSNFSHVICDVMENGCILHSQPRLKAAFVFAAALVDAYKIPF